MKKVLSSLILIFLLTIPINSSNFNTNILSKMGVSEVVDCMTLRSRILERIKEIDNNSCLSLDSLPIGSPINTRDIKTVSSDFGMRIHPILGVYLMHKGVDITAYKGAPIKSTACGVVEEIKYSKYGYGNEVVIRHSNGYKTRYAHLNKILVNVNDTICRNQEIGTLGRTGLTTGDHLHYEILKNEKQIDPMLFTYQSKKDRSIKNYITTLITLEYV